MPAKLNPLHPAWQLVQEKRHSKHSCCTALRVSGLLGMTAWSVKQQHCHLAVLADARG